MRCISLSVLKILISMLLNMRMRIEFLLESVFLVDYSAQECICICVIDI